MRFFIFFGEKVRKPVDTIGLLAVNYIWTYKKSLFGCLFIYLKWSNNIQFGNDT